MDSLTIKATEDSPEILFDTATNHFAISGESRPENAGKFYAPIIEWIIKFEGILYWKKNEKADNSPLYFEFKLEYFNSTSAKYIMDILLVLKKFVHQGYNIKIEWYYDKRADDMLDAGKEFSEMVELSFDFVEM